MSKNNFPYIAGVLGAVLLMVVLRGSGLRQDGSTIIPLLTLLVVCEFGAIVTAIGTYVGIRELFSTKRLSATVAVGLACIVLCMIFVSYGLQLWPK